MVEAGIIEGDKLKVFVSYSRRDLDFADQLVVVLSWQGFQPSIDRKGIHGAEKWEQRLGQLILEADIIVFVLSPDSAASEVCAWEVEEAVRRGKRIIPVLCRPLEDQEPHDNLRDLNYIHFYAEKDMPGSGFGSGLVRLIDALSVDVEWLREHTRFEELAARWDESGRANDLLVRGSELAACNSWRDRRPFNAPELTALQRAFIASSEEVEIFRANTERRRLEEIDAAQIARQAAIEEREAAIKREMEAQKARVRARRIITWGSTAGAVAIVIAALVFASQQQSHSKEQSKLRAVAQNDRDEAIRQQHEAESQTKLARAQKAIVVNLIQRISVGGSDETGVAAMKKICKEASTVTSTLAGTTDENEYAAQEVRFWELYNGPMNLIEIRQVADEYVLDSKVTLPSPIEKAMVKFRNELIIRSPPATSLPRTELKHFSQKIEAECGSYLP